MIDSRKYTSQTIASGQTTSESLDLQKSADCVLGIVTPAALTSTAITFEASFDGGTTWVPVQQVDGGGAFSLTVSTSQFIPIDPRVFAGVELLRIVGGSSEGADREIGVVLREVA